MDDDPFEAWLARHAAATGAGPAAVGTIRASRVILSDDWSATVAELDECTRRLAGAAEVDAEAVAVALRAVRAERPNRHGDEGRPRCPLCGGDGLVAVPVPRCVWEGRLVAYPGTRAVRTGAVLCDRPDCARGREVRDKEAAREVGKRRPAYGDYCRRFGGADLAGLLAEYERGTAARLAHLPDFGGDGSGVAEAVRKVAGPRKRGAA